MNKTIAALVGAFALAVAPAAYAADTLDFWDGHSASGECGTATLLGSQKIDDPFTPGIQQAGTIQKYKRTCSYPGSNQTCWNTRAKRIDGGDVTAGITWRSDSGYRYWLNDRGRGWISSPVICDHQVGGNSWGAWARIGGVDATLFT